ncbi:MAG TPA: class I mannose-6-phosphate isomerase [Bryobacteraceae bacterium]|nr:class I mannose-6-phosphate isomerase [Bryobacteraceae bacterium]HOL71107.1 class I mannose-6-phosphate isomerase [Bryobacteraceae bacterium]HOQ47161.1 class I mannose-6-phosphate isomerase [Bryobacteraceae bacterium]HPQ14904.1 class I mannose-6-phosphate isomerase [Bryobacteraceae bacterium]HPU72528.1 class I mannose-6-phosphate isomerase [Bryobacteraceae bacterium]
MKPVKLTASSRPKIWGATNLMPWFPNSTEKIGEVWFVSDGESLPILVKFIFTSERLSVQVHPDDEYARVHENSPGKTEMWHILRAEPGASIAVGLRSEVSKEELRAAAISGEIENLLNWVPVSSGDTIFTPAGTIHAIGAGLALCEIQQQSDVTYRLYDYGRPRELHLDRAIEVSRPGPHPGKSARTRLSATEERLAECPYFVTDRIETRTGFRYQPDPQRMHLLIVIGGTGTLAGACFRPGEAWMIPAGAAPFAIEPESECCFLRTYAP